MLATYCFPKRISTADVMQFDLMVLTGFSSLPCNLHICVQCSVPFRIIETRTAEARAVLDYTIKSLVSHGKDLLVFLQPGQEPVDTFISRVYQEGAVDASVDGIMDFTGNCITIVMRQGGKDCRVALHYVPL